MVDILLITPYFTQLNTPYPATAYLKAVLNTNNYKSFQIDLGLEVFLEVFSRTGLENLFNYAALHCNKMSDNSKRILANKKHYIEIIDNVISFLQGKNTTIARQLCEAGFLPQASRFNSIIDCDWAFGTMGIADKAKYFSTLFIEDISDFIIENVDNKFGFSRYAEHIGRSANNFNVISEALQNELSYFENIGIQLLKTYLTKYQPKLICFTIPFPGNLFSSFRCAKVVKEFFPEIKIAIGGGFVNTELRQVSDKQVFNYIDFLCVDKGEESIVNLTHYIFRSSHKDSDLLSLKNTFLLKNAAIEYFNCSQNIENKYITNNIPDYSDLKLDKYISLFDTANPMHRLWSDGRWNKLTMAFGCYWKQCSFCDCSLDYINNYKPTPAKVLVNKMIALIEQTGETGFHFVDEAAPPALMKELAIEIIRRKLTVTWWTNIRFEKNFTPDLCYLLRQAGCIGVSGGLEVASERLLKLINKGVTIEQVAKVCRNFTEAGIMVHAYLMHAFPSQQIQETIDSLEIVRQMFEAGIIQSGFWHQFALTAHSYIYTKPELFGIIIENQEFTFANNDIVYRDKTGINHSKFNVGLKKSLYNFMHGIGFEFPLNNWFDFKIPSPRIPSNIITNYLNTNNQTFATEYSKILWLGAMPEITEYSKKKKNITINFLRLIFQNKTEAFEISIEKNKALWLVEMLKNISIFNNKILTFKQLKTDFEQNFADFELFWYSKPINTLRKNGLLIL